MGSSNFLDGLLADTIGKCFEYSTVKNVDSYFFAEQFLNSKMGTAILKGDFLKPYNSFAYMFGLLQKEVSFCKGETYDPYIMWMYGYLVKYWVDNYNVSPKEIWKILPIDVFKDRFGFYHTQGWNYIIKNATKMYKQHVEN